MLRARDGPIAQKSENVSKINKYWPKKTDRTIPTLYYYIID